MKPLRSILTAGIALAMFSTTALRAETFPIFEDAAGSPVTNTIAKAAGAAKTLSVGAKSNAFISFSVGSAGIDPNTVTQARLVIFLPKSSVAGTLSIKNLTSGFTETILTKTAPAPTIGATLDTIDLAQIPLKGDYFISDITAQVKAWMANPNTEFGIAITSDGVATATLASKEGAGSGHPAFIEVDVNQPGGPVSGTTATFTGGVSGNTGTFTGAVTAPTFTGNAATATTAVSFTGSLAGDVTGTQGATVVSTVGGVTAPNVASGVNLANAAAAANTGNTIVRRDSGGNFTAGQVSAVTGVKAGWISNLNSSFDFANAVNVGTGGIYMPGAFAPANAAFVGAAGNFISFGHPGTSEDFLSYKDQTFYFRNTGGGGGDSTEPNVDVGNTLIARSASIDVNVVIDGGVSQGVVPLVVNGFQGVVPGTGRFFDINSNLTTNGPNAVPISIQASHAMLASGYIAGSDVRIKTVRGQSSSSADLATLRGIEITDYVFKDVVAKGARPQKKVIAQQVEKVFPQAVSTVTEVVPDIYARASVRNGWITLAAELKVGDRVRLIGQGVKGEDGIHEVLEVKEGAIRTAFQPTGDEVFVYGREVKDFRVVDYEAIAMLNVSATQELARKLEAKDAQLATVTQKLAELEARDQERETRLARLEGATAPARATTASLKRK